MENNVTPEEQIANAEKELADAKAALEAEQHAAPTATDTRVALTETNLAPALNELQNFAAQRGYTLSLVKDERGHITDVHLS